MLDIGSTHLSVLYTLQYKVLLPRRKQNKWRLRILIRLSLVKKPNKIRKRHFLGNTA